jgi:hypothetical protein
MAVVKAEFDGRVFVPCMPVDLAAGTRVDVILPKLPEELTADELAEWRAIERQIAASPPQFSTVDDAMQHTRKRP